MKCKVIREGREIPCPFLLLDFSAGEVILILIIFDRNVSIRFFERLQGG